MAYSPKRVVVSSTRSQVLSVNGKKLPRDARVLELLEGISIRIIVV